MVGQLSPSRGVLAHMGCYIAAGNETDAARRDGRGWAQRVGAAARVTFTVISEEPRMTVSSTLSPTARPRIAPIRASEPLTAVPSTYVMTSFA